MTKPTIEDLLAHCLRLLYEEADIPIPKKFKPEKEARKLADALISRGMGIKP